MTALTGVLPAKPALAHRANPFVTVPLLLAGAYGATFVDQGLSSAVSVALPSIAGSLGAPGDEALWSNVTFSAAYYVMILATPWIMSRIGTKRHYVLSLAGVAVASLACGLATSFEAFAFWRLLQGIALGGIFVNTLWSIVTNLKPDLMRYGLAGYGIFSLGGPALGPNLAGIAVDAYSWRWLFAGITVVAILSALVLQITLKPVTPGKAAPFDSVGIALLAATSIGYNVAVQFGELHDWYADRTVTAAALVAIAGLAAFAAWELWGTPAPLVPMRLLGHRGLQVSLLLGVGLGIPLLAATVFLTYLQTSLQFTPTLAGELIGLRLLTIIVFAPAFSLVNSLKLLDTRIIVTIGFACISGSYALQAQSTTTSTPFETFVVSVLISGIGFSAIFSPLVFSTVMAVGMGFATVTAALLKIAFTVGGSLANAALGAVVNHRAAQHYADLASAVALSRPAIAAVVFAHHQSGVAQLFALVSVQARTLALADAAWVTAIVTLVFVPFIYFLPTAKDEASGKGVP